MRHYTHRVESPGPNLDGSNRTSDRVCSWKTLATAGSAYCFEHYV